MYLLCFVVTAEQSVLENENERVVSEIDTTSHAILNALENEGTVY